MRVTFFDKLKFIFNYCYLKKQWLKIKSLLPTESGLLIVDFHEKIKCFINCAFYSCIDDDEDSSTFFCGKIVF